MLPSIMAVSAPLNSWMPLKDLGSRFLANVQALAGRMPELAQTPERSVPTQTYYVHPTADRFNLAWRRDGRDANACRIRCRRRRPKDLIRQLYPSATCQLPIADLWRRHGLALERHLSASTADTPRCRAIDPPLYFLIKDIERLWVILHVHELAKPAGGCRASCVRRPGCV